MLNFSITEIAQIVNGKLFCGNPFTDSKINQVIIDSREMFNPSNVGFVALKGPRNNGHHYISDLIEKKVGVFIVSETNKISNDATFILVKNTTEALQNLAAAHRKQFKIPVVGITGSNGKTIVKEWLSEILSEKFAVVKSPKSYNSQVGVPLSVLLMGKYHELAIFEAGISEPGEMQNLEKIIQPENGIFTTIGDAHQENFNSVEQKIREKLGLFTHSKHLIFNAENEILKHEIESFCEKNRVKKIDWSLTDKNATIYFSAEQEKGKTEISAHFQNQVFSVNIPFTDSSSIENVCHCFAFVLHFVKEPNQLTQHFSTLKPVAMRLEIKHGINNCLLINDFYNSDLNSLANALSVLHQQATKIHFKKTVIISDIEQTGLGSAELYKQVNQLFLQWKIDRIIGIGEKITANKNCFSDESRFYPSIENFIHNFNKETFNSEAILLKGARNFTFEKIAALLQEKAHQTVLEIRMDALINNLNVFRGRLKPETKIMVMVKAFSYGSGDVEVAKLLQHQNVEYLAVAVADEGVQLRKAGINTKIIVMNPEKESFRNIVEYNLEPNIYSLGVLNEFLLNAKTSGLNKFPVHLKIDTGMNRLGLKTDAEIAQATGQISASDHLKITSIFSHLAGSDDPNLDDFTREQINIFNERSEIITSSFDYKIMRHILNSAGIERFPEYQFDMVRLGIGLYGVSVSGLPLENIGTFKSVVSQVKKVSANETIGYSRKGKLQKTSEIAIVPVGYADGLDRKLGNGNGSAFIKGKKVKIVGNICMDMLMLDVTGLRVQEGDEVEFFGNIIPVTEVAIRAGTIPYEILTGISQRVKRVYLQE